jgi:dTDP-4-amino-4,6-dideoxygalactose transaminase
VSNQKIPVLDLKPEIAALRSELQAAFDNVLDNTAFIQGAQVKGFEAECAAHLGVKHAIGVNSGTDALVLGLRALGIGPGDEVITTPFTFFATAESISILGAKPVFVDIEPDTFNLDMSRVEAAITDKTKAVVPVHLFGHACDMDALATLCKKHNLKVVEDVAQAFGGKYKDQRLGALGDVGAYSFFPSKNLGGFGDGGLVVTNDDGIADQIRMLHKHGAKKKYYNQILGYNSRLDSLQAALLRVKLPHSDEFNAGRLAAAGRYEKLFAEHSEVQAPSTKDYAGHVFHQYTVRVPAEKRDAIHAALGERGIGAMIYYPVPCDQLPIYEGQYQALPESERAAAEVLSLPIWPTISEEIQKRVAEAVLTAAKT